MQSRIGQEERTDKESEPLNPLGCNRVLPVDIEFKAAIYFIDRIDDMVTWCAGQTGENKRINRCDSTMSKKKRIVS
jgi:hypothetical protein